MNGTGYKPTAALLGLTLLVGGAGVSFPLMQLLLNCAAVGIAAYFVLTPSRKPLGELDCSALLLLALCLLLPLLQLIPLPPAVWQMLPGREMAKQLDTTLGWSIWRPWTLDVEGTIRSWLVMLPAAVLFWGCLRLNMQQRRGLLWIVAGFALFNALLGVVQLVTGGGLTPYPSAHRGYPVGLFVNRNHSAAFMLAAMPVVAVIGASRMPHRFARSSVIVATLSALTVLAVVTVGTTSRMALGVLPVAAITSLVFLIGGKSPVRVAAPTLLGVSALALIFTSSSAFQRSLGRFSAVDELRFGYWNDLMWALHQYGFAGTGLGTFVPVFQSVESLESIGPGFVNHAHNDFLEIALETGIPGILLLVGFVALLGFALTKATRRQAADGRLSVRFASAASIMVLLLSSLVDYPLRMPAISTTFALLFACLLPTGSTHRPARADGERQRRCAASPRSRAGRAGALAILAGVFVIGTQAAMSARYIRDQRFDAAARWAPWSTRAHVGQSTVELSKSRPANSARQAQAALRLSPISAPAIRTLALVRSMSEPYDGDRLMQIAAGLGWRDPITQLWSVDAAKRSGEPRKALQRAEALFRQDAMAEPALTQLLRWENSKQITAQLVVELAKRPRWRKSLIRAGAQLRSSDTANFQRLVEGLATTAAPVDAKELEPVLDAWLGRGDTGQAQDLWAAAHTGNLVSNGSFDRIQAGFGPTIPEDWYVPGENVSQVSVAVPDFDPGNRALLIGDTLASTVLSQKLFLPPGAYTLTFSAHVSGGPPAMLAWDMFCKDSSYKQRVEVTLPPASRWNQANVILTVPPQDCATQSLAFRRLPGNHPGEVWIDRIDLRRAAR